MISGYKNRKILLVFRGVRLEDISAENIRRPRAAVKPIEHASNLDSIPLKFISTELWPKSSSLLCWHCENLPDTYPRFIPTNPTIDRLGRINCDPVGNYCNWNCAAADISVRLSVDDRADAHNNLCAFEALFTGVRRVKIPAAPLKVLLQKYSGSSGITREQWEIERKRLDAIANMTGWRADQLMCRHK